MSVMQTRISLSDLEIALSALTSAAQHGRGALESAAKAHGIRRPVVMHALNRVEEATGGFAFFVTNVRRTGQITAAGRRFLFTAPKLIEAWRDLTQIMDASHPA